jgi:hypothetical protein
MKNRYTDALNVFNNIICLAEYEMDEHLESRLTGLPVKESIGTIREVLTTLSGFVGTESEPTEIEQKIEQKQSPFNIENFLFAKKVVFLKSIFEDDFPERGHTAWLTQIEDQGENGTVLLHFDFEDFFDINKKYFTKSYYTSGYSRQLCTALEHPSGKMYSHKYSVYFLKENFETEILKYLKIVD